MSDGIDIADLHAAIGVGLVALILICVGTAVLYYTIRGNRRGY